MRINFHYKILLISLFLMNLRFSSAIFKCDPKWICIINASCYLLFPTIQRVDVNITPCRFEPKLHLMNKYRIYQWDVLNIVANSVGPSYYQRMDRYWISIKIIIIILTLCSRSSTSVVADTLISKTTLSSAGMTLVATPPFNMVRFIDVTFPSGKFNSSNFLFSSARYS